MNIIKRKILLEDGIYRGEGELGVKYGQMTADTLYVKVMLTQNIDNMGMMTDMSFISGSTDQSSQPDYTILENKLTTAGITFPFMLGTLPSNPPLSSYGDNVRLVGKELDDYWAYGDKITGSTDSKKIDVKGYNNVNEYITNFDINSVVYENYLGDSISGKTKVTSQIVSATTYVFDANEDNDIGTPNQSTGLLYTDYTGLTRTVVSDDLYFNEDFKNAGYVRLNSKIIPLTNFHYKGEGWNKTNTSLSTLTKEEYLFGITQAPEVQSDVFIDRGTTTVFEKHLRLSEVESLEHLERYNNGFYNLVNQ